MLPLQDDIPTRRLPLITWLIILLNVLFFLYELLLDAGGQLDAALQNLGLIPALVTANPFSLTTARHVLTSMFTHGGFMHIASNMLYLWIFGNNVEDALGRFRFILFYLICGTAAAATQVFFSPHSMVPMIGASGAIAGVLGAYLLLYPRARVRTLVFFGYFARMADLSALWVLGLWFVLQFFNGLLALGAAADSGGVAVWAHVGGFIAGLLLVKPLMVGRPAPLSAPGYYLRRRY
jgi:membrane associated rhomboid family serine protease